MRVGQAVGRGDPLGARWAGYLGILLSALFMLGTSILFWTAPRSVIALYLDLNDPANAEVVALAVTLLGIAAIFQIFDGLQVSAAGALRGLKDTRVPMVLGFVSYWLIGLPVSAALGFWVGWGAQGFWWGFVLGLASAAVLLTGRFYRHARRLPAATPVEALAPAPPVEAVQE